MSSAILYVAIVAIWAGVLIPRYLRRDTSDRTVVPDTSPAEPEAFVEDIEEERAPVVAPVRESRGESGSSVRSERARVLSARRRLLMLLVALAVISCVLAVTGLAAWWVVVPPMLMLGGYMLLLREAAAADAERRREVAPVAAAAPEPAFAPVPVPAPDAEIIDLSASRPQDEEEQLYDQYADAKLRAVGD